MPVKQDKILTERIDRPSATPQIEPDSTISATRRTPATAALYGIKWQVVSSGGTEAAYGDYKLRGTFVQTAVGEISSDVRRVFQGYWQNFPSGAGGCCVGIRGNANADGAENVNISDITYLVDYLFGIPLGAAPPCPEEGNANGDIAGSTNISDITYLVNYLFGIPLGSAPLACP